MPRRPLQIKKTLGSGTLEDPQITWTCDPPAKLVGKAEGNENMAREVAKMYGLTHVWIRAADHTTTFQNGQLIKDWDSHLTVYLGPSATVLSQEGHIYVVTEGGVPVRLMAQEERKTPAKGANPKLFDMK